MTAAFCFLSPRHKQTMRSLQWQGSIFRDADVTERGRGADCQAWCRGPHKHVCCNRWMEGEWDNGVLCNLGWTAAGMLEVFFFGFFFVCVSYVCGSTGAAVKSPDTVRLPPQTLPSLSLFLFFSPPLPSSSELRGTRAVNLPELPDIASFFHNVM